MPESASLSTIGDATRFIKITYPGTGNYSQFTYDGLNENVEIVETRSGSVLSTTQFAWANGYRREARDASSTLTAQYFNGGEIIGGISYFLCGDHHGSVREMTDNSSLVQAEYNYDPYGRVMKLQGSLASDFQYAGYYFHSPSALSLTRTRAYSPALGRFINRDSLGEEGGSNLFLYVLNDPIALADPLGLQQSGTGSNSGSVGPGAAPGAPGGTTGNNGSGTSSGSGVNTGSGSGTSSGSGANTGSGSGTSSGLGANTGSGSGQLNGGIQFNPILNAPNSNVLNGKQIAPDQITDPSLNRGSCQIYSKPPAPPPAQKARQDYFNSAPPPTNPGVAVPYTGPKPQ